MESASSSKRPASICQRIDRGHQRMRNELPSGELSASVYRIACGNRVPRLFP